MSKERKEIIKEFKKKFIEDNNDYHIVRTEEELKAFEIKKLNTWFIDGSGIYLTVKNRIGEFTAKITDKGPNGLPTLMKEKFRVYLPPIPGEIYQQIQRFFFDIADEMSNSEAFVQIYYDHETEQYVVHVPEQKVSGASVVYDCEDNLDIKNFDRYVLALEIHSHNTMSAFFSGTDNSDEKETRFYGVFGKIKDPTPEFLCRFVVNGKQLKINPDSIFDFTDTIEYPEEWRNKIHKMSETTGKAHLDNFQSKTGYSTYQSREPDEDFYHRYYNNTSDARFDNWNNLPDYVKSYVTEWEAKNGSKEPLKTSPTEGYEKFSTESMRSTIDDLKLQNIDTKADMDERAQLIHTFTAELEHPDIPVLCDALEHYGMLEPVRTWIIRNER